MYTRSDFFLSWSNKMKSYFLKRLLGLNLISSQSRLEQSKTFCIMPWVHFHVTQYGTVTPCCQAPWQEEQAFGNINKESINEIWQGEKIKQFRRTILAGKADKRCESCFKREKEGFTSLRKITNHKYKHKFDLALNTNKLGEIGSTPPVYFDIRFSNVCNLRCRICGPWSSSSWFSDAVKLGMIKEDANALTYAKFR
jgi:radical SAM protein with 4Fe4S-binding SPASM domain